MDEGNSKAPMIVHVSLSKHPLISFLSDNDSFKFKIILSDRTPMSSILFPSFRCSFLIVEAEVIKMNETTMKETCESFIRNNMNPFILVSSCSSEAINTPLSTIEIVTEANKLNIRLAASVKNKCSIVIPIMNMEVAAKSVLFILRRSEDKATENPSESQDKTSESKPLESTLPQPFPENFVRKVSETSMEAGNLKNLHTILDDESSSDNKVTWFTNDARFETERRSQDETPDSKPSGSTLPAPVNFVSKSSGTPFPFFGSDPKKVTGARYKILN